MRCMTCFKAEYAMQQQLKNLKSILRAAAVPDKNGTRPTRMTATLEYSRGHLE
jgi:hypothetical protein